MRAITKLFNLNDPGWGRGSGSGNSGQDESGRQEPGRPRPGGSQGGPPDLDEVWRDFNQRLGSLFGRRPSRGGGQGGGSGGGMPSLPKGSPKLFIVALAVAAGLWLASGFIIVQEGTVAVVTQFGKYSHTLNPGLQWRLPYPIQADQVVGISQLRTFEVGFRGNARNKVLPESLMLTTDENIVDLQFVVQYRLMPTGAPDYLFKTSQPDESVRQAAETAMREIVGRKPMDFVLYSGRTEVATEVQALAQSILDRYQTGIQVSTVAIQNVQPPEQVQAAFDDAVKAGQDRERQINEGNAYANQVLPEAQGQVARMVQQAEGYRARVMGDAEGDTARFASVEAEFAKAPDITRDRMYLSTMQDILQRTGKVFLDADSEGNLMYLPLDKLISQSSVPNGARVARPDGATGSAPPAQPAPASSSSQSGTRPAAARTGSGASQSLSISPYSR